MRGDDKVHEKWKNRMRRTENARVRSNATNICECVCVRVRVSVPSVRNRRYPLSDYRTEYQADIQQPKNIPTAGARALAREVLCVCVRLSISIAHANIGARTARTRLHRETRAERRAAPEYTVTHSLINSTYIYTNSVFSTA